MCIEYSEDGFKETGQRRNSHRAHVWTFPRKEKIEVKDVYHIYHFIDWAVKREV